MRSIGLVQIFLNFGDIVVNGNGEGLVGLGLGLVVNTHIPVGDDDAVFPDRNAGNRA